MPRLNIKKNAQGDFLQVVAHVQPHKCHEREYTVNAIVKSACKVDNIGLTDST